MNNVYAIMRISPRLERYAERADRAMEQTALDTKRRTETVVGEIERLLELKLQLVNLSVIYNGMTALLSERELTALLRYASGSGFAEVGHELGISCSSASRLLKRINEKCDRYLAKQDIGRYEAILARFA